MPWDENDDMRLVFSNIAKAWHYRIEGKASGTLVGQSLQDEETAKRWIARQHGVDISDVVCHTPIQPKD